MHNRKRMKPEERAEEVLQAALVVASETNYRTMTREDIAQRAGVKAPLVTFYFKSMDELRRQVMARAISNRILVIIAHGLVNKAPLAQ